MAAGMGGPVCGFYSPRFSTRVCYRGVRCQHKCPFLPVGQLLQRRSLLCPPCHFQVLSHSFPVSAWASGSGIKWAAMGPLPAVQGTDSAARLWSSHVARQEVRGLVLSEGGRDRGCERKTFRSAVRVPDGDSLGFCDCEQFFPLRPTFV